MSQVQQYNEHHRQWVLYDVASGDIVGASHTKFEGVDEIEPALKPKPVRSPSNDPLGDFR